MMWLARVAGGLIGIPAGLFGVAFGFLIGYLLDRILTELRHRRRIEQFVTGKIDVERAPPERKALAVVGLAVYVASADGAVTLSQTERIHEFVRGQRRRYRSRWEERFPFLSGTRNQDTAIRRLTEECVRLSTQLAADSLAESYVAISEEEERRELVGLLIRVARKRSPRVSEACRRRLTETAELLGLTHEQFGDLLANTRDLDAASCEILGVSRSAGPEEVKRVYRRLASQFHPDRGAALSEAQRREAQEAFLRIQRAYATLMEQLSAQRRSW